MQYLYGIFWTAEKTGIDVWMMHRNGRSAIRIARPRHGYVTRMPLPDPSSRSWDAPTFRALSDPWRDFRKGCHG